MINKKFIWALKLDWLNILNQLGLESIYQISEFQREKVIQKITEKYGPEALLVLEPPELELLVANELRRDLGLRTRKFKKARVNKKKDPMKKEDMIKAYLIDLNDPKAIPKEILKAMKSFMDNDDDNDDDNDNSTEDNTGYYI